MKTRLLVTLLPLALAACNSATSQPTAEADPQPPPIAEIHNGDDAGSCQWPSTVALLRADGPFCTGTLIHPRFVMTAAHCIDKGQVPDAIGFGEDGYAPERSVDVIGCTNNPLYYTDPYVDMAICELASPVNDVQPVPIALGCELDALQPDSVVQIVGYGNEQSYYNQFGDFEYSEGLGPKRFTPQAVYQIREDAEEIDLVGLGEFSSACHGDSGGGAFMQLADGSWRLVGVAQSLFVPDFEPGGTSTGGTTTGGTTTGGTTTDTGSSGASSSTGSSFIVDPTGGGDSQPFCGAGTTYTLVAPQMAWAEQVMKLDASPCFTASGDWDPGTACTPFPMELDQSVGSWADGCAGELGGEPQCGKLEPDPEGSTGTDTETSGTTTGGDEPETASGPTDSTTVSSGASTTSDSPPPGDSTSDTPPLGTSSGATEGDTDDTAGQLDESGCGCRSKGNAGVIPMLFGLIVVGRRRRRRSA